MSQWVTRSPIELLWTAKNDNDPPPTPFRKNWRNGIEGDLKISYGPPTTNLWSDWSPEKRVNCDKLNQRQKVRKSCFNQQFGHVNEHCFCSSISKTVFGPHIQLRNDLEFELIKQWSWGGQLEFEGTERQNNDFGNGGTKRGFGPYLWKLAPGETKLMFYSLQYSPGQICKASKIQYNTFDLFFKNTVSLSTCLRGRIAATGTTESPMFAPRSVSISKYTYVCMY